MGFRYLSVFVLVLCLIMDIEAAHKGKGHSKGGSSKGGSSKGGSSKGGSSKGGSSKGSSSKGGNSKGEEKECMAIECGLGYVFGKEKCACEWSNLICVPECSNGGRCIPQSNDCDCTGTGYEGTDRCESDEPGPDPDAAMCILPCENNGVCAFKFLEGWGEFPYCDCSATEYYGDNCEIWYN